MDSEARIPDEIQSRIPDILDFWRDCRVHGDEDNAALQLTESMERLVGVFVDFLRSSESVETFSQGGKVRSLVKEICASQHRLDRDAVGVIEDFAALRRAVWRSVESTVDLSRLDGAEVSHFFTKMLQAADWVTEAGLEAFESVMREEMLQALGQAAATDLVTGLPDRERFNRILLPDAISSYECFSIVLFDVADFSRMVVEGQIDQARNTIKKLAEAVSNILHENGVCSRFGDDEVCALLPGLGADEAYRITESVLVQLASEEPGFEVDVGVAEYPLHGTDAQKLIRETLKAMSVAKKVGGSGIVVARKI